MQLEEVKDGFKGKNNQFFNKSEHIAASKMGKRLLLMVNCLNKQTINYFCSQKEEEFRCLQKSTKQKREEQP